MIIFTLRNIQAMNRAMRKMARESESIRLFTRYLVPFSNTKAFPVMATS